ncbi:MAG: PIN domain-containing protein [Actinomycetota bacterium]|nr:PIN domain-containing protein [Actinomycetota bacterium]
MSKISKKRPIYVLDTNVLLYNPRAIYAFPNADVVIPDIVLGELDKVKTARLDRELRYRSREISRILFDLSSNGNLTEGIRFGKNSFLRVVSFDASKGMPEQFTSKNSDDKIISIAYQIKRDGGDRSVTIVTNDLNMLLKAQTIGIKVEHPGEEFAYGGIKRAFFVIKSHKQSFSTAVAVIAIIVILVFLPQIARYFGLQQTTQGTIEGPPELIKEVQNYQNQIKVLNAQKDTYESMLKRNPKDLQALIGLGNVYFDMGRMSEDPDNHRKAIEYYKRALEIDPNNLSVRTDMAVEYFNLNMYSEAISELESVIRKNPNFYQAYYNLGMIYYNGLRNLPKAREYFIKCIEKAPQGSGFAMRADSFIQQIDQEMKAR